MLEILQFYVSGFWVWLGLTIGLYLVMVTVIGGMAGLGGVMAGLRRPTQKEPKA